MESLFNSPGMSSDSKQGLQEECSREERKCAEVQTYDTTRFIGRNSNKACWCERDRFRSQGKER